MLLIIMKKLYIVVLAVASVGLLSCKGKTYVSHVNHVNADPNISFDNCRTITLNPERGRKIELASIAKEVDIIPLESTEEAVIGGISKIEYDDGLYFVEDQSSKQVFVFDSLGGYLNKMWRQGRGPGEVSYPNKFALDKTNKTVWVIDNAETVKKYSYSGEYRETTPWDNIHEDDFYINDNGSVYCYTGKWKNWKDGAGQDYWRNELTIIDKENEKHRYIPVDTVLYSTDSQMTINTYTPFSVLPESVTFHHTISNYIYSIDRQTDEVSAKYAIDFGEKEFKTNLATMETMSALNYIQAHPNEAGLIRNVVESENSLSLTYCFMKKVYHAIYNKQDGSIVEGILKNDLFGAPVQFIFQHDGIFVGVMSDLDNFEITDKAKAVLPQATIDKLGRIDTFGNPVLIVVKL